MTLIPEEFEKGKCNFKMILDMIESTMIKRLALGRDYGVIVGLRFLEICMMIDNAPIIDFDRRNHQQVP